MSGELKTFIARKKKQLADKRKAEFDADANQPELKDTSFERAKKRDEAAKAKKRDLAAKAKARDLAAKLSPRRVLAADNSGSGNCEVDVNECASKPCKNGAKCSDSSVGSAVSFNTYQCTCTPGYANGWCEYDYISEVAVNCTVFESDSSSTLSGNCDVDVNECASSPCKNGATCSESTTESKVSIHTYQCTCKPGYSNGWCEYDYISEGTANCTVFESDDSTKLSGN